MAIKLLVFKDHGYFTAIILNISKQIYICLAKKWRAAKEKKTEIPSIYNNTHMQQYMQEKH